MSNFSEIEISGFENSRQNSKAKLLNKVMGFKTAYGTSSFLKMFVDYEAFEEFLLFNSFDPSIRSEDT